MCAENLYWLNELLNQQNIIEFFIKFSRFEYALKTNGYHKQRNGILIETNFDKFAKKYQRTSLPLELKNFLIFLNNDPVGKLTINGNYQKNPETGSDILQLLNYLRRIRNNLFHGVKYPNLSRYEQGSRGERLINDGIKSINFLVRLDEHVYTTYKG